MERAEHAYGVPMLEAYGMTEASHQMASNPLPPGARIPGSVGVADRHRDRGSPTRAARLLADGHPRRGRDPRARA